MDWDKLEQEAFAYLALTPHQLYEFTYNEYSNMISGYQIKREEELKKEQFNAWHIACYVGMSFNGTDLPNIGDILSKPLFEHNKLPEPESDKELTKDQLFLKRRTKWMKIIVMGVKVPDNIIDEYNIKI